MAADSPHVGHSRVVQLFDHSEHNGPHGFHLCLVLELLSPSFFTIQKCYHKKHYEIPVNVVKNATRQILEGLDYLHQSCGIIHTGKLHFIGYLTNVFQDLQSDNILIQIGN